MKAEPRQYDPQLKAVELLAAEGPTPAIITTICDLFDALAVSMAHKYAPRAELWEDLEQVARMGLVDACHSFQARAVDEDSAIRGLFIQHVSWTIRDHLSAFLVKESNPVRLPDDFIRRLSKLRRTVRTLTQALGREPTVQEIVDTNLLGTTHYANHEAAIVQMLQYDLGPLPLMEDMAAPTLTPEEMLIERENQRELQRQRGEENDG